MQGCMIINLKKLSKLKSKMIYSLSVNDEWFSRFFAFVGNPCKG